MAIPMKPEITAEAIKAAPPIALFGVGLTLNDIVASATLIYIALQVGYLIWKWRRELRKSRAPDE